MNGDSDSNGAASGLHEDVLQWWSRQQDGELSSREQVLLSDHLDGCPRCAAAAHELGAMRRVLRSDRDAAELRAPIGLADRIVARLAPDAVAVPRVETVAGAEALPLRAIRRSALLAAACLAGLAVSWFAAEPGRMSAATAAPALGHDDPLLDRLFSRWQERQKAPPSFFELLLPPDRH